MYINEIFKNRTEKNGKIKGVNVRNGLYLGNQKPLSAEKCIKWLLRQYYAILCYNLKVN